MDLEPRHFRSGSRNDMSVEDPTPVDLTLLLQSVAGTYLRNPLRRSGGCAKCAGAANSPYATCYQCQWVYGGLLPDLAGFMTYAADATQAGYMMYGYKARTPLPEHRLVVMLLLQRALVAHKDCPQLIVGRPLTHWTTVPSTRSRPGPHPLHGLVGNFRPEPELVLHHVTGIAAQRKQVVPALFRTGDQIPHDSHVRVIDDTWTSGGIVLSAVHAVRTAGARAVTVMCVARWLSFDFMGRPHAGNAGHDLHSQLVQQRVYDLTRCPYTGGRCPQP